MIQTEQITGTQLVRTYSDIGMLLERDGAQYEEAIDPIDSGRVYVEIERPIKSETPADPTFDNPFEILNPES